MPPESLLKATHVYTAMVAIAAELVRIGIAKDRKNDQQGFQFRGIDDVMNAVSPLLAKHEVVFRPSYSDYSEVERVTAKGSTLIHARVTGTYAFVSAKDGSELTVTTFGVAMDSGDKACNKAMSAALKYALLQTFLAPTESTEDADQTTPEPSVPKPPDGFEEWFADLQATADNGFEAIKDAWRKSPEPLRDYAMQFRAEPWDAAKKKATKVSADLKKRNAEAAGQ